MRQFPTQERQKYKNTASFFELAESILKITLQFIGTFNTLHKKSGELCMTKFSTFRKYQV